KPLVPWACAQVIIASRTRSAKSSEIRNTAPTSPVRAPAISATSASGRRPRLSLAELSSSCVITGLIVASIAGRAAVAGLHGNNRKKTGGGGGKQAVWKPGEILDNHALKSMHAGCRRAPPWLPGRP